MGDIEKLPSATYEENESSSCKAEGNHENTEAIALTWRSWVVVFVSCFAIMAQVFVVVGAGSVIAFIVRDIGDASISGWIIQGPLLMQSVLSPSVGKLSDVFGRKTLACALPMLAAGGAILAACAKTMPVLIGGNILIGTTLASISIVQAIPAEVLPMKYRALANGCAFIGGGIGGLIGTQGSGSVTSLGAGGWRNIFWMQCAFHLATATGLFAFYWPPKPINSRPRTSWKQYLWALDPVGSVLFVSSATLIILALDWAGGAYEWRNTHVSVTLSIGVSMMLLFGLYEWKGRDDGIIPHVLFRDSLNFPLSTFAFAVEGWIFYSAVNSVTPQIVLNLGFETNSQAIGIRQLGFNLTTLVASIPIIWYSTRYKDLKWPLFVTFGIFLIVTICYGFITPAWNHAQIALNVLAGIGQAGPLTLLVALIQFTAPHENLGTATGLAFSARSLGGAFGSAVLDAIINGKISQKWSSQVANAAVAQGLPVSSISQLITALRTGSGLDGVPGISQMSLAAALTESRLVFAEAYRLAWWSIVPFVALAMISVVFLMGVKPQMNENVESPLENLEQKSS